MSQVATAGCQGDDQCGDTGGQQFKVFCDLLDHQDAPAEQHGTREASMLFHSCPWCFISYSSKRASGRNPRACMSQSNHFWCCQSGNHGISVVYWNIEELEGMSSVLTEHQLDGHPSVRGSEGWETGVWELTEVDFWRSTSADSPHARTILCRKCFCLTDTETPQSKSHGSLGSWDL